MVAWPVLLCKSASPMRATMMSLSARTARGAHVAGGVMTRRRPASMSKAMDGSLRFFVSQWSAAFLRDMSVGGSLAPCHGLRQKGSATAVGRHGNDTVPSRLRPCSCHASCRATSVATMVSRIATPVSSAEGFRVRARRRCSNPGDAWRCSR